MKRNTTTTEQLSYSYSYLQDANLSAVMKDVNLKFYNKKVQSFTLAHFKNSSSHYFI